MWVSSQRKETKRRQRKVLGHESARESSSSKKSLVGGFTSVSTEDSCWFCVGLNRSLTKDSGRTD